MVDQNRMEGAAQGAIGKVEKAVGGLTGDTETQAAGTARQAAGETRKAYGKVSDQVRQAIEVIAQAAGEQPVTTLLIVLAIVFALGRMSATPPRRRTSSPRRWFKSNPLESLVK
jgi:uncharacterized protein YjbJ (UPF0337 family)